MDQICNSMFNFEIHTKKRQLWQDQLEQKERHIENTLKRTSQHVDKIKKIKNNITKKKLKQLTKCIEVVNEENGKSSKMEVYSLNNCNDLLNVPWPFWIIQ